jgi:hypothetical protein
MSRMLKTLLVAGACAVLILSAGAARTTPDKVDPGTEWLAWSTATREVYVRGFIEGYGNGSEAACKLADDLFHVDKHQRVGEGPRARCENRLDQYTQIKTSDSGFDFSAYSAVITDFYAKHPEYQKITYAYLLSLLNDRNYKTADQLYQMALKGTMNTHF